MLIECNIDYTSYKQALALDAARQSLVLLQNHGGLLPLSRTRHRRVAVIGNDI